MKKIRIIHLLSLVTLLLVFLMSMSPAKRIHAARGYDLSRCDVTLSTHEFSYNGNVQRPKVTVTYYGTTLVEGTDYCIQWDDCLKAGTKEADILPRGINYGKNGLTYKIRPTKPSYELSNAYEGFNVSWNTETIKKTGAEKLWIYLGDSDVVSKVIDLKTYTKSSCTIHSDFFEGDTKVFKVRVMGVADSDVFSDESVSTYTYVPTADISYLPTKKGTYIYPEAFSVKNVDYFMIYRDGKFLTKLVNNGKDGLRYFDKEAKSSKVKKYVYQIYCYKNTSGKLCRSAKFEKDYYYVPATSVEWAKAKSKSKITVKRKKSKFADGYVFYISSSKPTDLDKWTRREKYRSKNAVTTIFDKLKKNKKYYCTVQVYIIRNGKKYYSPMSSYKTCKTKKR